MLAPTNDIQAPTFRIEGAVLGLYRDWAGDGLLRLSVGLEDSADLIADLKRALG